MKSTIHGFNQSKAIKFELDNNDLLILRYFIDFKDSGKMLMKIIDNKPFYWLNYSSLIESIPIISITSNDALRRRLKKLEKYKVLEHRCIKIGGSYSYYAIGDGYKELLEYDTEKSYGATQKSEGYDSKVGTVTTEKSEQKINLLNNESIKYKDIYTAVIKHLNNKLGSNYKADTKGTQQLIKARLKEGFSELDFIKVIDIKVDEWKGTNFAKFLRPQTLFGNKFENYLNQKGGNSNGSSREDFKQPESEKYDFSSI